jgi:hypothetical protein
LLNKCYISFNSSLKLFTGSLIHQCRCTIGNFNYLEDDIKNGDGLGSNLENKKIEEFKLKIKAFAKCAKKAKHLNIEIYFVLVYFAKYEK